MNEKVKFDYCACVSRSYTACIVDIMFKQHCKYNNTMLW